ncbi:class Ib ribonucleoside-diphosphate reductase assembly flavoprotein NrdI [[Mycoplasma] testudinis]|uniref:class Ib ribonucleoside-diphosphate reductase assembly flavoprotein NrdI n=1 Tax=[Mycoplasma] testudinis TaxID=33924 RepID=UPI0004838DDE|nr:class Ib ribonucleoside-diphosphate reductase assembly flavoprotein NrdI [[Mycoplasma] testudinis]
MKDLIKVAEVQRPTGACSVVYFSSISNNTHRFIQKLDLPNHRIPYSFKDPELIMDQDYVLICPTYAGGGDQTAGAVPKQVIKFLNNEQNRIHCKAVIASGNTNFGETFAIAGPILSKKLNVPLLYQFELLGTAHDVEEVKKLVLDFWNK